LEYLIALLLGTLGSLVACEISLRYRKWCEAIVRSAAHRLPDEQRLVREEEWLAALNDCVGMVSAFSHAIGCWVGAPAVGASASLKRAVSTARSSSKPVVRFKTEFRIDTTAFMRLIGKFYRIYAKWLWMLAVWIGAIASIWPLMKKVIVHFGLH
jgi:hypothetical protein